MEDIILVIVKDLLSITIGFVALVLTAFSILMTLPDTNWKIVTLKKSVQYKKFIQSISNLAIGFTLLFMYSIVLLMLAEYLKLNHPSILQFILFSYIIVLFVLSIYIIILINKFRKIIILSSDSSKPKLDMTEIKEEDNA